MAFSQRVKAARLFLGMNQSELARASGLTRAAISKWESHPACKPDASAALAVAKALGVSVENLLAETKGKPKGRISKAERAREEELILSFRNHIQNLDKTTRTDLMDFLERLDHRLTLTPKSILRHDLQTTFTETDELKKR